MWMLPIIKIVMLKDLINCIYFSVESILIELSRLVNLFVIDCIRSKRGFDTGRYPLLSIISMASIFFIGCKQRSDSDVRNSTSCDRMHFWMILVYLFFSNVRCIKNLTIAVHSLAMYYDCKIFYASDVNMQIDNKDITLSQGWGCCIWCGHGGQQNCPNPRSNETNNNVNPEIFWTQCGCGDTVAIISASYLHFLPKIDMKRVSFFLGTGARVEKMSDIFWFNFLKYFSV